MSRTVRCWGAEDMQILGNVVQLVPVNVVDDRTRLGPSDSAMRPLLSVGAFRSVGAQALGVKRLSMCAVRLLSLGVCRDGRSHHGRRRNLVAAPHVFAGRKARDLLRIGVKRVAVPMPHLVVPHAQVARCDRAVGPQPCRPSGTLGFRVASCVCRASGTARALRAFDHNLRWCKPSWQSLFVDCQLYYKALGNSWAAPVVRWIGERIQRHLAGEL